MRLFSKPNYRKHISSLILLALLGVALPVGAGKHSLESVLERDERPSMLVVKKVLKEYDFERHTPVDADWARQNGYDERIDIPNWTNRLIEYAPRLIAILEKAYPGATWVFIGRDGAAFADVLEAFYYTQGEKKRVLRLGVSKASFDSISYEMVAGMLKQKDYDVLDWKNSPPILFIDPVSKGNGRQGRTIVSLLYDHLIRNQSADLNELVKKINMIGLIVSTHSGHYNSINDIDGYYNAYSGLASRLRGADWSRLFQYHIFPSVDPGPNAENECGYTHFIGAWHDSYGEFYLTSDGAVKTKIGQQFSKEMKLSVIWSQYQIWKAVESEVFEQKVRNHAKALGYVFPASKKIKSCEDVVVGERI